MTETTRIRWQPGAEAWATAWFGYVGTLDSHLFEILRPGRSDEWTLITTSGTPGIIADSRYGSDPDVLKAEAERWLEEFTSSLGAVFPDEPSESVAFQVSEARDLLDRWDRERAVEGGDGTERTLADQVRNLLAIVDRVAPDPATPALPIEET